jgi:hypothetical protein
MIVCDLDGTIIPEGTQELEPGFTDVLQRLLDRGFTFYIASGRTYASISTLLPDFMDKLGFLCENGALVMEKNEVRMLKTLPPDLVRAVAGDLNANPHADIHLSGKFQSYVIPKTDWYVDNLRNVVKNKPVVVRSLDEIPEPVIKLAAYIYDYDENVAPIRQAMTEKYGAYAEFVGAGNDWLDMIPYHTGKGYTLQEILEQKGLQPDEILVFGDNENDISMLALTPNSYAKSNSPARVKEIAGASCDSVTAILNQIFF